MHTRPRISLVITALATLATGLLTGCSANFVPGPVADQQVPIGNIQGMVHGGQAPVTGAQIYLYQASTSGYGTNATSLICNSSLMTGTCPGNAYEDSNGNYYVTTNSPYGDFSLTGDYLCTSGKQVYMVAVGGNSGGSGTINNTAIVQMAALGQCPASGSLASQVPYVVINEVTTVAFAYSVSGFATNAYNVSTDASGTTALANAFANANNITLLQWGVAPGTTTANPNGVNPQAKINTLANLLATCVNSSSPVGNCQSLFNAATTSSGVAATDEANAIFNIAHNQAQNVLTLFRLIGGSGAGPFSPSLGSVTDWTLPIVYKSTISPYGTNLVNGVSTITSGAFDISADTNGNMWIGDEANGVVKVTPLGTKSLFSKDKNGNTFGEVKGVAVAPSGNIWVSDSPNNQITLLNSAGTATVTTPAASGQLSGPAMIAFDASGNGYVANDGNGTMSVFDSSGVRIYGVARTFGSALNGPAWIALDSLGDAFLPSQNNSVIGGDIPGKSVGSTATISPAYALAIDSSDNLWMPNNSGSSPWSLYQIGCPQTFNSSGVLNGVRCAIKNSLTNGGSMNIPDRIALDGNGTLWIANQGATTVSAYNTTSGKWLSASGFQTGAGDNCLSATPDISGNLWTGNKDGSVTELLGLAAPTMAPYMPGNYQKKP